jgi:MoxR-like ATPase
VTLAHLPTHPVTSASNKIPRLLTSLDAALVERRRETRLCLLALLAGHHVLLLGPPGTAKSYLARSLARCIRDASYFEHLLTEHTHPDELYGPLSIPALEREEYRRLTEGYLPSAHVAFLDEVFDASGPLFAGLLPILNERIFHNGKVVEPIPLLGLICAANALPVEGGRVAFVDRVLVTLEVQPVRDDALFLDLCTGALPAFRPDVADQLTLGEVQALRAESRRIGVPHAVREALLGLRRRLAAAGCFVSDRRWRWGLELVQLAALTSGRREVSLVDLLLLDACLGSAARRALRETLDFAEPERSRAGAARRELASARELGEGIDALSSLGQRALGTYRSVLSGLAVDLDQRRVRLEAEIESSPWLVEAPSAILAGLIEARREITKAAES